MTELGDVMTTYCVVMTGLSDLTRQISELRFGG